MPEYMDRVVDLTGVVAREIAENVALGVHDADSYFLRDEARRAYSFVCVPHAEPQDSLIVMLARIRDDNMVIIETDHTDTPLYKSLIEAGVPRSQIIRAYLNKTEPEP